MSEPSLSERVEQLDADNARLRLLLARQGVATELRHQVRNTLATVRAVIRRSAEIEGTVDNYAAHLEGRLDAILRVQSAIIRGPAEGADLRSLLSGELLACLAQDGRQVQMSGPDVFLRPRAAEAMALAFHELATNALKFGSIGGEKGRVEVSWQVLDHKDRTPRLDFTWTESDGPTTDSQPSHRGFGTEVLEQLLPYQLGAETALRFPTTGLCCSISLPLPQEAGFLLPHPGGQPDPDIA